MTKRVDLEQLTERYEQKGQKAVEAYLKRAVEAYYLFKRSKMNIVAGASTFFLILSFCPILMFLITSLALFSNDIVGSQSLVLTSLKENFPGLAQWILTSIEKIVQNQVKEGVAMNWFNAFVLLYSSLGVVGCLKFGLNNLTQKTGKNIFIIRDLKAISDAVLLGSFVIFMMIISPSSPLMLKLKLMSPKTFDVLKALTDYQIFHTVLGISFFGLYYKWVSPVRIRLKDTFIGGSSFVALFLMGKTFYWVYLHYYESTLVQNFGNFYTLVIAVTWVYFMAASFLFGAAMSYVPIYKRKQYQTQSEDGPNFPEVPKNLIEEQKKKAS